MLNYQEHDENNKYVYSPTEKANKFEMLDQTHDDTLEDYLDRVCAPLVGEIQRSKREEIRARVRQRIEQFATAHRELGSTPEEAIELALAQCGDPKLISQRWLPEHRKTQMNGITGSRAQISLLNRLRGSVVGATAVSLLTFGLPYLADNTHWSVNWWAAHSDNTITYYRFMLFSVPLLAGILTGLAAKHKPVRGVSNAIGLLTIPAIGVPGLVMGLQYAHLLPQDWTFGLLADPLPAVCGVLPWIVIGCSGAALGRKLRSAGSRFTTRMARVMRIRKTNKPIRLHNPLQVHVSASNSLGSK